MTTATRCATTPGWPARALTGAVKSAPKLIYYAARRKIRQNSRARCCAASVYRTVRPLNQTGSALMNDRNLIRHVRECIDVPMRQFQNAAHRCGGALNDAFVAGVAGGLRRYHEKHSVEVGDLHLSMPISLRTKGRPDGR